MSFSKQPNSDQTRPIGFQYTDMPTQNLYFPNAPNVQNPSGFNENQAYQQHQVPQQQPVFYGQPNEAEFLTAGHADNVHSTPSLSKFPDCKIRHGFIRKVYLILTVQLAITIGFILLFLVYDPIRNWFHRNVWIHWVLIAITFVVIIVLSCCDGIRRQYPMNMVLLFGFTLVESLLLGSISATYETYTVLMAIGITTLVVVGLTIFSFQTKIDFTGMGIYLFVFLLVLFGFGLIAAILRSRILDIVYGSVGAGLFSFYLVYDTQLMMGES
jgi:FtsH-binding integral membrane protein